MTKGLRSDNLPRMSKWHRDRKNDRNELLLALHLQHPLMPYAEIARRFGISRERVRKIIARELAESATEGDNDTSGQLRTFQPTAEH